MDYSKEIIALTAAYKDPILDFLKSIKAEAEFTRMDGILNYVESVREKFVKTKTFLYKDEKMDFYDIYFPISLQVKKKKNFNVDRIEDLFSDSNFIAIIGSAGSGKSMLVKHIFLKSIEQFFKIPILIELRCLNDFTGTFEEYVYSQLIDKNLTPNTKILDKILSNGYFFFILDGYDEIFNENLNKITSELNNFIDNKSENHFLITSRPGANVESLPRFNNYHVNTLSKVQIQDFIKLQLKHCEDEKLIDKILSVISKPENKDYNSYLSSPLLLSMFILTFNNYPELPKTKSKFYWNVYDTLCTKHDTFTKQGAYQHERKTKLENEEIEKILQWFAFKSLMEGKYSFDNHYLSTTLNNIKEKLNLKCSTSSIIEDVTVAIPIIIVDGIEYKFPHKSLQEYFAALLIKGQNEDNKLKIYSGKFASLKVKTFGGNQSFWDLCLELDSIGFKKYFLLRYLEEFFSTLDLSTEENICKSFLSFFNFMHLYKKDDHTEEIFVLGLQWSGSIHMNILEYLCLFDLDALMLDYENPADDIFVQLVKECHGESIVDDIQPNEGYQGNCINYKQYWNDSKYIFIVNSGMKDVICSSIDIFRKKIQSLKDEIEIQDRNNDELLDF